MNMNILSLCINVGSSHSTRCEVPHLFGVLLISIYMYSETWQLGTPRGLRKSVLNSEVVLFLRSISTY